MSMMTQVKTTWSFINHSNFWGHRFYVI